MTKVSVHKISRPNVQVILIQHTLLIVQTSWFHLIYVSHTWSPSTDDDSPLPWLPLLWCRVLCCWGMFPIGPPLCRAPRPPPDPSTRAILRNDLQMTLTFYQSPLSSPIKNVTCEFKICRHSFIRVLWECRRQAMVVAIICEFVSSTSSLFSTPINWWSQAGTWGDCMMVDRESLLSPLPQPNFCRMGVGVQFTHPPSFPGIICSIHSNHLVKTDLSQFLNVDWFSCN